MGTNVAGTWDKAAKLLQECNTKQPGSAEANAVLRTVKHLVDKVFELPPQPKAVWKKLVQQLKVPLQLGAAFTAAAQHSWSSDCTHCAFVTLQSLIQTANEAGVTKGAGSSSLASSMRQQLEHSGMLQQLAAVMTAAAADLQDKGAAHAAGDWSEEHTPSAGHGMLHTVMLVYDLMLGLWAPQSADVDIIAWLCHPSGHAAAGMQLTTAVLQHASVLVQHLRPELRQRMPHKVDEVLTSLQTSTRTARKLGYKLVSRLVVAYGRWQQQGEGSEGEGLQQLLLAPERLPFAASMLVLLAADVSSAVAAHNAKEGGSSSRGCSSSTPAPTGQHQHAPGGNSSSSGSSSSADVIDTQSVCQLHLLQLLGLAPEVTAWAQEPVNLLADCSELRIAAGVCKEWCAAVMDPSDSNGLASWQLQLQQLQLQQRRQVQQQLLLLPLTLMLLPAVLLPCASSLLSPSAQHLAQQHLQHLQETVQELLDLCSSVLFVGDDLSRDQESLGWLLPVPPVGWVQEVLGLVLQLVDDMLHQQPPTQAGSTGGGSSSSNDSGAALTEAARAGYLARLLPLLCTMLHFSQGELCQLSSSGNSSGTNSNSSSSRRATAAASQEAARFARLGPVLEAVLRAVTTAMQNGTVNIEDLPFESSALFTRVLVCRQGYTRSALVQHMGLCGPEVVAQEQRQLYSLLSTVLKMGRPCWGAGALAGCCAAAGEAAVGLLLPPTPWSAAAQQPAADYLPSLVIFGRCCLQWAKQLRQRVPQLLQLASEVREREAELQEYSATLVLQCSPPSWLRSGAATVSEWVGGVEAPAALAQLEAAGCAPQQLQPQLQALLSAVQGMQQPEGLTDASLTALVQQLQTVGAMLCNIAVPHFCNNPGCGNISGLTEVQLVSARSCICAGCHIARYCGRDCQRVAWKQHKPVCKALAAAAAVVAAPAAIAN